MQETLPPANTIDADPLTDDILVMRFLFGFAELFVAPAVPAALTECG